MDKKLYGLMAEFNSVTDVVKAAERVRDAGFTKTDAFSPFPIHEMDDALGIKRSILSKLIFLGGVAGCLSGLGLVYWTHVIEYPIIVAGRPHFSLPAFIPPLYELTILFAAFVAVFGMLFLNGLPQPYHPVFNMASRDSFFLLIESDDEKFNYEETKKFMESLNPQEVHDVEE
jgi:hypothetical protein